MEERYANVPMNKKIIELLEAIQNKQREIVKLNEELAELKVELKDYENKM